MSAHFTRRDFMKMGAAALGAATFPYQGASASSERVVFANWGGSWERAVRRAWADPFTKATKIPVISASDNSLGRLQAMVQSGNVEWDLMEGLPELARVGAEHGLLEKLDFSVIHRDGLMNRPEFFNDYSIPEVIFGRVLTYDKRLPEKPTSWAAFWDLERFPGKRAFQNKVANGVLEVALLADGVPGDQLYPLDLDRAFKKLEKIRDHIVWFTSVPQSEQVMREGQASLGLLADGRALNVKNSGAPVDIASDVSLLTWSVFVVPKGARNKDAAMRFLDYVLGVDRQVAIAMEYNYGPVVPAAWDKIPEARRSIVSGSPEATRNGVFLNADWWTKNLETTNERFHEWLLG